jgi:hyperosmotically inducible protein
MSLKRPYINLIVCLVLTVAISACAGDRTSRSTGQVIDDTAIAAKVKSALIADSDVKGMKVNVDVSQGVVELNGVADSAANRQKAVRIARNVEGVREVRNNLVVR